MLFCRLFNFDTLMPLKRPVWVLMLVLWMCLIPEYLILSCKKCEVFFFFLVGGGGAVLFHFVIF